jgi:hypothetical protein
MLESGEGSLELKEAEFRHGERHGGQRGGKELTNQS